MAKQTSSYPHKETEAKWQECWNEIQLNTPDMGAARKPYYNLMMFPYPSAEGLHVGNMYAFTGADIHGRFMKMQGYDVFEPIGLDGFGIHSENYALKIGRHPKEHARITQKRFYQQLHTIGIMADWSRTLETYDPGYYRFTQWLFVQMFKHGLAYRGQASVNYCPSCKTVLSDEQVIVKTDHDGTIHVCERCGNIVEKRLLKQWFFRITAYAEKLLKNISRLKWSEKVKTVQSKWIGKKTGCDITYPVVDGEGKPVGTITVFTTRPDTNFGATFLVLAPEHPFVSTIQNSEFTIHNSKKEEIASYVAKTKGKSQQEREMEGRKKTGVFTGLYAHNQLNDTKLPIYVSDFVLMNFGTGAVVGVPGHDLRDFEFAQAMKLPIVRVVVGSDGDTSPITRREQVQEEEGVMVNSGFLDGMTIHDAIERMISHLEEKGWAKRSVSYHLRDWTISRQRYWGAPIPMIYCETCAKAGKSWFTGEEGNNQHADNEAMEQWIHDPALAGWYPVPEAQLPVELPDIQDYKPTDDGKAPLAKHKEFYETVCPGCGSPATRETDVCDTFLDSSWYFLRYPSIGTSQAMETGQGTKIKTGKNQENLNSNQKTIQKTIHNSEFTIQNSGEHGKDSNILPWDPTITKQWLPVDMYTGGAEHSVLHLLYSRFVTMALLDMGYVPFEEPFENFFAHGLVIKDGAKMSKSKGNVVNPDEYISAYGADALRMYLMFMGPLSDGGDFSDTAMEGMFRWLGRVWRLIGASAKESPEHTDKEILVRLHTMVAKMSDDMPKRRYNTAIAQMMEFTNVLQDSGKILAREDAGIFIRCLAPFAPHIAEELWQMMKGRETIRTKEESVHTQPWPVYEKELLRNKKISFVIQVNGKTRAVVEVEADASTDQATMETLAKENQQVQKFLTTPVKKTIFVPGRLVNFVV